MNKIRIFFPPKSYSQYILVRTKFLNCRGEAVIVSESSFYFLIKKYESSLEKYAPIYNIVIHCLQKALKLHP